MANTKPPARQNIPAPPPTGNSIVDEAQRRFHKAQEWEGDARKHFLDDLKFANGDAYNGWQWDDNIRAGRDDDRKPSLTINMTRQHNLQIKNEMKKNKPGISVKATGGEATYKSAQGVKALMGHIWYRSNASLAVDVATEFQVDAGFGCWRVSTDYIDDKSFNQEILIKAIYDPLTVYFDPDARERDKSDARFVFLFDDCPRDLFESKYPNYVQYAGQTTLGNGTGWVNADIIRVCEYWRKVLTRATLYARANGQVIRSDEAPAALLAEIKKEDGIRSRDVLIPTIEQIIIVGNKVVKTTPWPGKYIPIVPVVGEETVIEKVYDRKGHTRALLDPQRIYNYWSSAAVEYGALQTKTPWTAAAEAIEGYETYWNNANQDDFAILPYRSRDDAGNQIDAPQRIQPPVAAPVALTGMSVAQVEMMRASGQFSAQLGEQGNERSAVAITQRQGQSDTATFHFADNLGVSIRHTGKIILDLIPKIYDTERVLQVMSPDGYEYAMTLDPNAKAAYAEELGENSKIATAILNPNLGMYDVEADIGPAYATRREEAFNAFKLILTQAPNLTAILGDILFRAGDFPYADEAGERLRRMVPPEALGTGPSAQMQQLMQDNSNLKELLQRSIEEIALANTQIANKERADRIEAFKAASDRDIGRFDALTKRLKVLMDKASTGQNLSSAEVKAIVEQAVDEALNDRLNVG